MNEIDLSNIDDYENSLNIILNKYQNKEIPVEMYKSFLLKLSVLSKNKKEMENASQLFAGEIYLPLNSSIYLVLLKIYLEDDTESIKESILDAQIYCEDYLQVLVNNTYESMSDKRKNNLESEIEHIFSVYKNELEYLSVLYFDILTESLMEEKDNYERY